MARTTAAAALSAALSLFPASGAAQRPHLVAPRWSAELGAALGTTPYVKDDNGARVTGGVGPVLGVGASWPGATRALALELGLRVARLPVSAKAAGTDIDVDPALHADLVGAGAWTVVPRLTLRGGLTISYLKGDDRVVPFRNGNASPWHPGAEVGAAWRLTTPLALVATVHGTRLGAASVSDPARTAGVMLRTIVGVRYAR